MAQNLYTRLFKYRPRPTLNPLEDFITEALADLLGREGFELASSYLNIFFGVPRKSPRENIRITTQLSIAGIGRIDLAIFWTEHSRPYSLFIENKVWSNPWVIEAEERKSSGNSKNSNLKQIPSKSQIDSYCFHQRQKNQACGQTRNFVALVSPHLIKGFHEGDLSPSLTNTPEYAGNKRWSDVSQALNKIARTETSGNLFQRVIEFSKFLKENNMTGFEGFHASDLGSIVTYRHYEANLSKLTNLISENFTDQLEKVADKYSLQVQDLGGHGYNAKHFGPVATKKNMDVGKSDLWIHLGLSTENGGIDKWWPSLTTGEDCIPDVQVMLGLWDWENLEDQSDFATRHKFLKGYTAGSQSFEYLVFNNGTACAMAHRRPLVGFLADHDQWSAINNFLQAGLDAMMDPTAPFEKAIEEALSE